MRIKRSRAYLHVDRCKKVRKNNKYLDRPSEWNPISGRLDKGAFKVDGRSLYICIDGSSTFREWMDNLNVGNKDGAHRGFAMAATDMLTDLMKKTPRTLTWYNHIELDGHSRGGAIVQYMAYLIRKVFNNQGGKVSIEVVTSGAPVLWSHKMLQWLNQARPYMHHAMRTARDIVDDVNAPKGFFFRRLWRKVRLYHYTTVVYNLPTVRGKIDHLAYKEAIEKSSNDMWG